MHVTAQTKLKLTPALSPDKPSAETMRSQEPQRWPFFRHTWLKSAARFWKVVARAKNAMPRAKGRRGERAEPKTEWSKKAAARTVFSTISHQHQITPSKHTHGTTFLVLKSLGPILCNNPPLKTSKFPTFLGEPFCSPVSPPSFIFPLVMLDLSLFRNFVFSGCPVWPRFAPTALDTASDLRHDLAEKTGMTTSTKTLPSKSSSFLPWNSCCHSALVPAFSSHFPSILGSRFRRLVPHCDSDPAACDGTKKNRIVPWSSIASHRHCCCWERWYSICLRNFLGVCARSHGGTLDSSYRAASKMHRDLVHALFETLSSCPTQRSSSNIKRFLEPLPIMKNI